MEKINILNTSGLILTTVSAFILASDIFISKKIFKENAMEESATFFGRNIFHYKSQLKDFNKTITGLMIFGFGFAIQLVGEFYPVLFNKDLALLIILIEIFLTHIFLLLLMKIIDSITVKQLVSEFGKDSITGLDTFIKNNKWGEKAVRSTEIFYEIKKESNETDLEYFKRVRNIIVKNLGLNR